MFSLLRPAEAVIWKALSGSEADIFSYSEVGASRTSKPAGYNVDHNRMLLGHGEAIFNRAKKAIAEWKMFDIGWVRLIHPQRPIEVNMNVGILAHTLGLYSLSFCRVAYLLDEAMPIRRWGFGYGTLTDHIERGEERFSVEWLADDSVWYDILAFSQPRHPLARAGYLTSRYYQGRFARDSKAAMSRTLSEGNASDVSLGR